ncbi:MAG TPA: oligosaccharide flippase family protein [Candidatus Nanoarchaeia archaeon]|nr:oligosaccharide flippase family protein [Candidatus Nanoarchaeia archaeon]
MFKKLLSNQLILDNLILFFAFNLGNFLGFLYHFLVGRWLGPANYGLLGSLLSILTLLAIFYYALQNNIAKQVSELSISKNYKAINLLFKFFLKRFILYGFFLMVIFLLFSGLIADYLNIHIFYIYLMGLFFIVLFLLALVRGILQGLQWFKYLGLNYIFEGFIKLFSVVIFFFLGFNVFGAVFAVFLSNLLPIILGILILNKLFKKGYSNSINFSVFDSFSFVFMLFSLTAFYTLDVFMIKHYFSLEEAGYYIALTVLGKIILAGSLSISQVMIPKLSLKPVKEAKLLLLKSLGMILIFLLPVLIFYFLFPNLILTLFYGSTFLPIANLLGLYCIFISFNALLLALGYFLVIMNKSKILFILFLFNILEIFLIYFRHNSLKNVISNLVILISILFVILFIYTMRLKNENNDCLSPIKE